MTWSTRHVDDGYVPFLVDDDTGIAYVDPDEAELLLTGGEEVTVDAGEEPPAHVHEFLDRETDLPVVGSRQRRYEEVRIGVGAPVLVAGRADPDGIDDLDEPVTTAIAERGDAPKFYVTDDPDHGVGRRLVSEALGYFLVAAILLSISAVLVLG